VKSDMNSWPVPAPLFCIYELKIITTMSNEQIKAESGLSTGLSAVGCALIVGSVILIVYWTNKKDTFPFALGMASILLCLGVVLLVAGGFFQQFPTKPPPRGVADGQLCSKVAQKNIIASIYTFAMLTPIAYSYAIVRTSGSIAGCTSTKTGNLGGVQFSPSIDCGDTKNWPIALTIFLGCAALIAWVWAGANDPDGEIDCLDAFWPGLVTWLFALLVLAGIWGGGTAAHSARLYGLIFISCTLLVAGALLLLVEPCTSVR
jgi:hypothetical protein